MAEPDAFHRALAALQPPEGVTELADMLLAALRNGHDLVRPENWPKYAWVCPRCNSWVDWVLGTGVQRSSSMKLSCLEATREWAALGYATPGARAWLAEHDRTEAR